MSIPMFSSQPNPQSGPVWESPATLYNPWSFLTKTKGSDLSWDSTNHDPKPILLERLSHIVGSFDAFVMSEPAVSDRYRPEPPKTVHLKGNGPSTPSFCFYDSQDGAGGVPSYRTILWVNHWRALHVNTWYILSLLEDHWLPHLLKRTKDGYSRTNKD